MYNFKMIKSVVSEMECPLQYACLRPSYVDFKDRTVGRKQSKFDRFLRSPGFGPVYHLDASTAELA